MMVQKSILYAVTHKALRRAEALRDETMWEPLIEGITYLLTTWSRVLPEKLKRPKLLKKFPAFYGIRRFITIFTKARHLSLS